MGMGHNKWPFLAATRHCDSARRFAETVDSINTHDYSNSVLTAGLTHGDNPVEKTETNARVLERVRVQPLVNGRSHRPCGAFGECGS
jgi:hypothetical protein